MKQVTSGSISYFHADHLGSTNVLMDGNGNSEEDLVYYPYGETFTNTGTADVAYKYTGKERDGSTGLYFYEARYYDAALGRFISADTIVPSATAPQTLNRYTYANNNPILYTDPSGHFFKKAFKKVKKHIKAVEKFSFDNRAYITLGSSIVPDMLLRNKTIGPYARIIGMAAASYYGGPWGALGAQAYLTRLDGGSFEDAAIAGGIGLVSSYAGGELGSYAGGVIGGSALGSTAGTIVGGAVGGAASGALGAHLSGGDPAQGALYGAIGGAASAAASLGATAVMDAVKEYYAALNAKAVGDLTVNKSEIGGGGTLVAKARRPYNNRSNIFELPGTLEGFNELKSTIMGSGANRSEFYQRFGQDFQPGD